MLWLYAFTVVGDEDHYVLVRDVSADFYGLARSAGLNRVLDKIGDGQFQHVRIEGKFDGVIRQMREHFYVPVEGQVGVLTDNILQDRPQGGLTGVNLQWTREIEKAGAQAIHAIDLTADIASHFGHYLRALFGGVFGQHFGRSFNGPERIPKLVSKAGGELAKGGEALGATKGGLRKA